MSSTVVRTLRQAALGALAVLAVQARTQPSISPQAQARPFPIRLSKVGRAYKAKTAYTQLSFCRSGSGQIKAGSRRTPSISARPTGARGVTTKKNDLSAISGGARGIVPIVNLPVHRKREVKLDVGFAWSRSSSSAPPAIRAVAIRGPAANSNRGVKLPRRRSPVFPSRRRFRHSPTTHLLSQP